MPDPPDLTLEISAPKFSVSEAIKRIIDYTIKDKTIIGNASNYAVVSAVYGLPDRIYFPAFKGDTMQVTDKTSEPSWFVTLHSAETDSNRIYRLMDDGSIQSIMHLN